MANSFTLLADIKACRCSTTAEVRLLRFWEAPNVKRGSKLMGVDMLLIDEQIRESLEEEVSELNFPRSPRDSRPRAAAVAGSGSSPSL
ncbi:hypothetical protein F2Q69_00049059 [Brassica cretica]|uniref:Uncharacterized protein n=1 Tax=Brassica cretica TaxID=69181 RepID=A0A8S9PU21_BRACR|nr:hypothetical protein F2Q69_00049059 [Brassica cretica]